MTLLRLVSIEKQFAIFYYQKDETYFLLDLCDNFILQHLDLDLLRPEDVFKIGFFLGKKQCGLHKTLSQLQRCRPTA